MKTFQSIALAILLLVAGTATSFSQEKGKKDTTTFTCPMHPGVKSDQPGKCPKCGMDLIVDKSKSSSEKKSDTTVETKSGTKSDINSNTKAVYTCPMHPDVLSDKPGDCPKCGMALVEKNKTKKGKNKGIMRCCM